MKKTTRAVTLLTAVSLTFGSATTIAPTMAVAAEAQEQTMAEQYEPYAEDILFNKADQNSERTYFSNDATLPEGTTFRLLNANVASDLRNHNGILFSLRYASVLNRQTGRFEFHHQLSAQQSGDYYNDGGNSTTARILVQYPDGSQDIAEVRITIFPTLAQVKASTYSDTQLILGETKTISPSINSTRAEGTQYTLIQSANLTNLREQGWDFSIDNSTGQITATAPDDWAYAELEVLALYPDGTSQAVKAKFNAAPYEEPYNPEPTPDDRSFGSSSS
ncbi:MAG: YPDG domain-containing protein [Corynebacterium glutamicum]|nr:YPDG domain-containing protein [Corynebacterium glutamicum]